MKFNSINILLLGFALSLAPSTLPADPANPPPPAPVTSGAVAQQLKDRPPAPLLQKIITVLPTEHKPGTSLKVWQAIDDMQRPCGIGASMMFILGEGSGVLLQFMSLSQDSFTARSYLVEGNLIYTYRLGEAEVAFEVESPERMRLWNWNNGTWEYMHVRVACDWLQK